MFHRTTRIYIYRSTKKYVALLKKWRMRVSLNTWFYRHMAKKTGKAVRTDGMLNE